MLEGRMTRMKSGDLSLFLCDLTVLQTHLQEWKGEMLVGLITQQSATKKTRANHLDYSCMVDSFASVLLIQLLEFPRKNTVPPRCQVQDAYQMLEELRDPTIYDASSEEFRSMNSSTSVYIRRTV